MSEVLCSASRAPWISGFTNPHRDEQAVEDRLRPGWTPGNVHVDRHDAIDTADRRIGALAKEAAAAAACPDRDDHARLWRRVVGAPERDLHIARHRSRDEQ